MKEGITTAFGIPGAAINPVYQYLKDAPIDHYTMRHEEACVHAADGKPIIVILVNNAYLGLIRQNQMTAYHFEYAVDIPYN